MWTKQVETDACLMMSFVVAEFAALLHVRKFYSPICYKLQSSCRADKKHNVPARLSGVLWLISGTLLTWIWKYWWCLLFLDNFHTLYKYIVLTMYCLHSWSMHTHICCMNSMSSFKICISMCTQMGKMWSQLSEDSLALHTQWKQEGAASCIYMCTSF